MRNPVSRFAYSKSDIDIRRSSFDRNHRHLTTMSAGLLYPLLVDEVLPGDTYSIDMSSLLRMSTPIHPVMDNCFFDCYFFYCRSLDLWDHWKEFMGESPTDPYLNPIEYSVPVLEGPVNPSTGSSGVAPKSVLDYMGIPSNSLPKKINALPIRGFCKIWNEWFRDQNLQNAINVVTDDSDKFYYRDDSLNYDDKEAYIESTAIGGHLPPVNKYHDYFTSALLQPQKGNPVPIPLNGFAPVYASDLYRFAGDIATISDPVSLVKANGDEAYGYVVSNSDGTVATDGDVSGTGDNAYLSNLVADLSRSSDISGVYATIMDLRYAFQLQKFLEADSRGGTRYREILKQHFNVTSPDVSQHIPEFLGGKRIPINIAQVLQTSSTDDVSPQGNTAAYSLTHDSMSAFTKSFTEHGYIFCVGCIRTEHTYQQGFEKMWSRFNRFDYYFPEFANISEQPIYIREIWNPYVDKLTDDNADYFYNVPDEIFGYQEAWADYRYKPNRISGEFRSTYPQSLDVWHYGDFYENQPYLENMWIQETRANIDRTLAVNSSVSDQFICDFYFKMRTTRAMPIYSIPGLADHH